MAAPSSNSSFVPRITQLDAAELDYSLQDLIKSQFLKAAKYLKWKWLVTYDAEINAALRLLVWKFTIDSSRASVGQHLLQTQYGQDGGALTRSRSSLLALLSVLSGWLKDRWDLISARIVRKANIHGEEVGVFLKWLELTIKVASVANFMVFLLRGQYPSLVERLANVHHVPAARLQIRQVGYEYMARELIWHSFSEFLMFIIPLINFRRVTSTLSSFLSSSSSTPEVTSSLSPVHLDRCALCRKPPILPYHIGCEHVFCYVCIAMEAAKDNQYPCAECGYRLKESNMRPVCKMVK